MKIRLHTVKPIIYYSLFFIGFLTMIGAPTIATTVHSCAKYKNSPSVHCGSTPSGQFDQQGRLWVVFEFRRHIYISHSDNLGREFSQPTKATVEAEDVYTNGENRPKIAFGQQGEIYISWTQKTAGRFTGDIRFSRSLNHGKNFAPPQTINDDHLLTGHRFDSLYTNDKGHIYLVWLDKRDQVIAKKQKKSYNGSAVYYSVSTDHGENFVKNRKIADNSCECCRISIHKSNHDGPALFWRHIFETNTRDHAFAVLGQDTIIQSAQRITNDNWKINACPHHGPSMTHDGKLFHMSWFTNSDERKGIFYGRYDPSKQQMENITSIAKTASASHPDILYENHAGLQLAWKEFDGEKTNILIAHSDNNGTNWLPSKIVASTSGPSDHPFLLKKRDSIFLIWHTKNEGLRLTSVLIDSLVTSK